MKHSEFSRLIKRIGQELDEIQNVLSRIHQGWEQAHRLNDDLYLDSVALNLHGFYSGFERIFIQIAETVDDDLPRRENWHELLLRQMMAEKPNIRPAVISAKTGELLDELRRFRHVVRNVYAHKFTPENIERLIRFADEALGRLSGRIDGLCQFSYTGVSIVLEMIAVATTNENRSQPLH